MIPGSRVPAETVWKNAVMPHCIFQPHTPLSGEI